MTDPNALKFHGELHVPDFEAAKQFYGVLGFTVVWERPARDRSGYLAMARAEQRITFYCGNERVCEHSYRTYANPLSHRE